MNGRRVMAEKPRCHVRKRPQVWLNDARLRLGSSGVTFDGVGSSLVKRVLAASHQSWANGVGRKERGEEREKEGEERETVVGRGELSIHVVGRERG